MKGEMHYDNPGPKLAGLKKGQATVPTVSKMPNEAKNRPGKSGSEIGNHSNGNQHNNHAVFEDSQGHVAGSFPTAWNPR